MTIFQTRIAKDAESFAVNRADMLSLIEKLRALETRAELLSEKRRAVFDKRGQLSPRERLAALLDPGMPFLELYNIAGYLVDDPNLESSVPGCSMIVGIGFVSGVRCLVFVDDSGINAGASTAMSVSKALGALAVALKQKLPFVHCVESAGANLMAYTVELWANGGGMFELRPCCRTLGYFTPVRERGTKWDNIDAIIQTIIRQLQLSGYMSLVRRKAALPRSLGSLGRS